jgi:signal transduction histidine kinase
MPDRSPSLTRDSRNPVANYLAISLLIALVLLLAWMQYGWLTELREEEIARSRVALRVAATNYAENIGQRLGLLLERIQEARSVPAVAAGESLFEAVVELGSDGSAQVRTAGSTDWRPATRAELQQLLGRRLIETLAAKRAEPEARLWLDPPAVVYCPATCQVGVLDAALLGTSVLMPVARRMFADFDKRLRTAVVMEDNGVRRVMNPPDTRPVYVGVTDLEQPLLADVPVLGPPGSRWLLKVNHGDSSLEAVVWRAHVRNVLLSGGLLGVLLLGIGLVVFNARRQVALAREQLYFVAGVSHELRTPLSVISSAADNLADRTVSDATRVHEYGELIRREVKRLKGMIENVLQFAQSASTTRPRVSVEVDMAVLVRAVIADSAALLRDRELQVEIDDPLPLVRGDRAALYSALANLLTNAARHASGGNWIRIHARTARVRPRGRVLRISISNPVTGRQDAHPGKLFEPFYRGQEARAAGIPGAGIGLAVARNVAQQHGGGMSIDMAQHGVIKFNLYLPLYERTETKPAVG